MKYIFIIDERISIYELKFAFTLNFTLGFVQVYRFFWFCFWKTHLALLRVYSWLCTSGDREAIWVSGIKPWVDQAPIYWLSFQSPVIHFFFLEKCTMPYIPYGNTEFSFSDFQCSTNLPALPFFQPFNGMILWKEELKTL